VCQAHNGVVLGSSPSGPTKIDKSMKILLYIICLSSFLTTGYYAYAHTPAFYKKFDNTELCVRYLIEYDPLDDHMELIMQEIRLRKLNKEKCKEIIKVLS